MRHVIRVAMAEKPVVFISYAHKDLEGVRKIHTRLAGRYRIGSPPGATHTQSRITTAIDLCNDVYRTDQRRNLLHGSAAAALTARASADGVTVAGSQPPAEMAQRILDELLERQQVDKNEHRIGKVLFSNL